MVADLLEKKELTGGPHTSVRGRKEEEKGCCCAAGPGAWLGWPIMGEARAVQAGREKGRWREGGRARIGLLLLGRCWPSAGERAGRSAGQKEGGRESEPVSHFPFMKFPFYFPRIY